MEMKTRIGRGKEKIGKTEILFRCLFEENVLK